MQQQAKVNIGVVLGVYIVIHFDYLNGLLFSFGFDDLLDIHQLFLQFLKLLPIALVGTGLLLLAFVIFNQLLVIIFSLDLERDIACFKIQIDLIHAGSFTVLMLFRIC